MIKSDGVAEIKECSLVARQPRKRCDGFGPDRGHVSPLLVLTVAEALNNVVGPPYSA
jgi:hypothetical protein